VEAREPVGSGRGRIDLLARYAATVRDYNGSLVTVAGHPASVQYGYSWRPEERFYGVGPSAPLGRLTGYASQTEWARAMLRFAGADSGLDGRPWSIVEMWGGPRSLVTRRGREPGVESLDAASPQFAPMRDLRVDHFVTGVRAAYDSRTGQPHWGSGTRLAASAERYDAPLAPLALHSARDLGARFIRYQLEGETGVSFRRDPRTLRLLVRLEDQRVLSGADRFAPADFAVLGGNAGLSGFPSGRFHDLDALQGRLSYLFPISRRLELDLHSEWGAVMPDVWRDARLAGLEHSAGFAVRARWERAMLGSLGMDFSREGGRLSYFLGSVR
jgi:hypothetical protein